MPKFNIGDKVYYLAPKAVKIVQTIIAAVNISISYGVSYQVNDTYITVFEESLGENKDSLMKGLNENIAEKRVFPNRIQASLKERPPAAARI